MCPKDADGITNSVDTDQTLIKEQSDLGLHCLLRSVYPKTKEHYGTLHIYTTWAYF